VSEIVALQACRECALALLFVCSTVLVTPADSLSLLLLLLLLLLRPAALHARMAAVPLSHDHVTAVAHRLRNCIKDLWKMTDLFLSLRLDLLKH